MFQDKCNFRNLIKKIRHYTKSKVPLDLRLVRFIPWYFKQRLSCSERFNKSIPQMICINEIKPPLLLLTRQHVHT